MPHYTIVQRKLLKAVYLSIMTTDSLSDVKKGELVVYICSVHMNLCL